MDIRASRSASQTVALEGKRPILHWLLLFVLVLSAINCSAQNAVLLYPEPAFNSDTCCWRTLSSKGEYIAAAQLVESYLDAHGKAVNRQALHWHAGQLFAMAGANSEASNHFHKTYNVLYKWFGGADGHTWYYYAKGTVAFLQRNRPRIERYLRKWRQHYPEDINYRALMRLLQNWDKPYKDAA